MVDDEPKSRNIIQTMMINYCDCVEVINQANSVKNAKYLYRLNFQFFHKYIHRV